MGAQEPRQKSMHGQLTATPRFRLISVSRRASQRQAEAFISALFFVFTMRFDSLDSALGILMGTADMLDYTKDSKLIMDGAPEFGAQIGTYMMTVAGYAQ